VDEDVDAAEGEFVGAGAVAAVAGVALAVVGGVDVEAAVGLAERADVGGQLLVPEELVQAQQVLVAVPGGDLGRGDQLVAVVVVGGGDVQHRPGAGGLPAADRLREVGAPVAEGLDHRRVLVGGGGKGAEVGRVAGVGDPAVDLLAGRFERGAAGVAGQREQGEGEQRHRGGGEQDGEVRAVPGHSRIGLLPAAGGHALPNTGREAYPRCR